MKQLQIADLVMFKGEYNRKLAKLIQIYTKSEYTHCGIVVDLQKDKVFVAEAQAKGYVIVTYDYPQLFNDTNLEFWRPKFKTNPTKITQFALNHLGTPYGFVNYIGILLHSIFGFVYDNGTRCMICSEAVVRAYGIEKHFNKSPEYVYPGDIIKSNKFKLLK